MSENIKLYEQLRVTFPQDKIKKNYRGYDFIPPEHVIDRLNTVLGTDWDWDIIDIAQHRHEWGTEVVCTGALTINGRRKMGIGGDTILYKANDKTNKQTGEVIPGNPMDDPVSQSYKKAVSNCLKLCARMFGVGNQLWGGDDFPETAQNDGTLEVQNKSVAPNVASDEPTPLEETGKALMDAKPVNNYKGVCHRCSVEVPAKEGYRSKEKVDGQYRVFHHDCDAVTPEKLQESMNTDSSLPF